MTLLEQIELLDDNRKDTNKDYELGDIVFLAISAVLSGAKDWKDINIFGKAQLEWLQKYR